MTPACTESNAVPEIPRGKLLVLTAIFEGGLFAISVLLGFMLGVRFWENWVFNVQAIGVAFALTIPLLLIMGLGIRSSLPLFGSIRQDIDRILPMFRNCTVLELIAIGLLAGICEEALFRGVLQPLFAGYVGPVPGLILAALLFGAVHPVSRAYVIFALGIGLYLGAVQVWLGNVIVPMAVHGFYDVVALVYLCRVHSGNESAT